MIETIPHRTSEGTAKTYPKGRRCNSCDKFLSIYNEWPSCAQCRPERTELAPMTKQHEREAFLDALTQIMEETS